MPTLPTPTRRDVTTAPPVPIDDITRRDLLRGIGALGAGWVLAGCGTDTSGTDEGATSGTRPFVDDLGQTVQVPRQPRRIVALSDSNGADQLLSLRAPVVGTVTRGGTFELGDVYNMTDISEVGEIFEVDLERIAGLEPDLIVGPAFDGAPSGYEEVAGELGRIAPTVWIDFFQPVREVMARVADLVAATENLAALQNTYAERVDALRRELEDPSALTVSVVQFNEGVVDVFGEGWFAFGEVLAELGATRPPNQRTGEAVETCCASISLERMSEVDGDVLLYYVSSADHSDTALFRDLQAVRAGQAHQWTDDWWGNTYRALDAVLDDLDAWLVGADPDVYP